MSWLRIHVSRDQNGAVVGRAKAGWFNNANGDSHMSERRISSKLSVTLAIICFVVAAIPASGIVMKSDVTGRLIFGGVWFLVGLAWLGGFLRSRRGSSV